MTPEQEQWLISSVQRQEEMIQRQQEMAQRQDEMIQRQEEMIQRQQEMAQRQEERLNNHDAVMSEIREGQAMLAQYFREALDRFDRRTDEMMTEIRGIGREVADLRQDFLNHMTMYHPPTER